MVTAKPRRGEEPRTGRATGGGTGKQPLASGGCAKGKRSRGGRGDRGEDQERGSCWGGTGKQQLASGGPGKTQKSRGDAEGAEKIRTWAASTREECLEEPAGS